MRTIGRHTLTAAACLAFLATAAPTASGHEARRPSIDLSDIDIEFADASIAYGSFTITNVSGAGTWVMIESIDMHLIWIGQGGVKLECANLNFQATAGPGGMIFDEYLVEFWIQCLDNPPFEVREIKVTVEIKLNNRDKIFFSSGDFDL